LKMLNTPFSPWPCFTEEEIKAVSQVLRSNQVNYWNGEEGRQFEKEFAEWTGSKYAVTASNGTVALELALVALNLQPGDEVIVTPRTFFASVSTIVAAGGVPVFADVDPDSQNITSEAIEKVLTPRAKAIVCVHLAGWPCEMDGIMVLAEKNNLYVIEDCAQAHGSYYKGRSVGSIGHIGAWSFCQDKIMTTAGEGGMVTTSDESFWKKMWAYKDHGKSYDKVHKNGNRSNEFSWLHESFGINGRLTEMQCAVGRIQIKRMPEWSRIRRANSDFINRVCSKISSLYLPQVPEYIEHARYKNYMFVRPERLKQGWSRNHIVNEINRLGVPCYTGCCAEVYLEKAFDGTSWRPDVRLPVAKELGETSLMFLVHPTLSELEIEKTCTVIKNVLESASI
jgi:dTDP-4-amino-4,6-dideoxygalactose transaminase